MTRNVDVLNEDPLGMQGNHEMMTVEKFRK